MATTGSEPRRTPLSEIHPRLGARMVEFAGWWMPLQYSGIMQEARAVRKKMGMFDISHMGRLHLRGEGAVAALERLTTNDVAALTDSAAQYSLLTTPQGGILDDIIVYRLSADHLLIVVNAANADRDRAWIEQHLPASVSLEDATAQTAMIAVQGPKAVEMVSQLVSCNLVDLPRFHSTTCEWQGHPLFVARTGYTGEDGVELIVEASIAEPLWNVLRDAGATPCGLGARDVLRIEAGYPLYGHELSEQVNPIEAGLGWVVSKTKQFIGSDVIQQVRQQGPARKLVGLEVEGRMVARQGYPVQVNGQPVGEITSGTFSPTLERSIALAFLRTPYAKQGEEVQVDMRGRLVPARVASRRFVSHV
ncbi:MAG: glycine cleavage system aminomethyltransferase GcvT [Armatimonadota bacterium]|nr:glycine cleavage system aminomethyltransferase GcvT [Armatimonadota bacterium]MDW8290564.1 glycine cleavage system aminomethyltransferase GcvT [Armatimonadota bacterium]